MGNLIQETRKSVKDRQRWVREARSALELVRGFPQAIQELEGVVDLTWGDTYRMELEARTQEKVDEIKHLLGKELGFAFEEISFDTYSESFTYRGTMPIKTNTINSSVVIVLKRCPRPTGCKLEEILVTETVTRKTFKAICGDTGKEI
jgi:hypothetical protein